MVIAGFGNKTFLKAERPCSYSWREAGDTLVPEARNRREKHIRGHRMLKLKKSLEIWSPVAGLVYQPWCPDIALENLWPAGPQTEQWQMLLVSETRQPGDMSFSALGEPEVCRLYCLWESVNQYRLFFSVSANSQNFYMLTSHLIKTKEDPYHFPFCLVSWW